VATRELQMRWEPATCEVCGRSLLRGERAVTYYEGDRVHAVCDLCTTRAHRQGWIREGTAVAELAPAAHAERARSLVARLRGRREAPEGDVEAAGVERAREGGEPAQGALPHHVQALPSAAAAQTARALGLFNLSEHPSTVAGVTHSLGSPYVRADATGGPLVDVLVIWELCWYRYEIDLENSVVRLRGQGYEPSELGAELRPANAIAEQSGKLALAAEPAAPGASV
jgi:hypothetical protein